MPPCIMQRERNRTWQTVVSFVLRWNPLFVTLKRMIADGAIGKPYCVEADYLSHNGSWWSGWNDAAWTHAVVFAVQRCYATGRPCRIDSDL